MITALLLAILPAAAFSADGFTYPGVLNGGVGSPAFDVNGDGSVLVGWGNDGAAGNAPRAFRWTQAGGLLSLGVLNGGTASYAYDVNADGSVAVGLATDGAAGNQNRAFRWTQAGGMVSLGVLNGGNSSEAYGVSGDGGVVVGWARDGAAGNATRAFRWTQAGGIVSLGILNGGAQSGAAAVNTDGSVVVGWAADGAAGGAQRAFRWTQAGGLVSLGVLNGGANSQGRGVNSDGNVVVGDAADGAAGGAQRAFRWTQAGGLVSLGAMNGGSMSSAKGVSSDGSVVVGEARDGAAGNTQRAFRWTQAGGLLSVEGWLRANGVTVPADITNSAKGVSADGSIVVGQLDSGPAFIARVSPVGSGLITLQELQGSLSANSAAPAQAASLGGLALHGAHSRPLARRVDAGKSCVWTSGDLGRDDHGSRDGEFGLAEIGGCHRFNAVVQGSLSVGRVASRQDLSEGGRSEVGATYGMAEVLANVPGTSLWPSLGLLYLGGEADARRGYLNAGARDSSNGRPGIETAALRARLDWEDAARLGAATITPYGEVSFARTRIVGYTETGGSFPARFDARTEDATELHAGADGGYKLSSRVKLLSRLEAAHRFEKSGAATSGQVLGLFSFTLPGQEVKRDWLRGGAGVDVKFGDGIVSAMLNATTQGADPSYWLNLGYQLAF
ncbi:MAG: autotransporter domain-containing protein [Elusimicrobia bacterium]|nr:autotransporter domain-containing protein [Elusimicrobiota bacterium]